MQRTMRVMPLVNHGTIASVRSDDLIAVFTFASLSTLARCWASKRQALANFEAGYSRGRDKNITVIGLYAERHHVTNLCCDMAVFVEIFLTGAFWIRWQRILLARYHPAGA
jgi:hypothetical protein